VAASDAGSVSPMTAPARLRATTARANDLEFGLLEAGSGPLALCLHGFPDTAHTWEHLLPALAGAGFHAVAPFMRGYAPTAIPADGAYQVGALVADAVALHETLGGDGDAVLIGHDWGAETAYGAAAFAPDRWRRLVTLAVPPAALDPVLFSDYEQLKRLFYTFMFRDPNGFADAVVARDGMAFLTGSGPTGRPASRPAAIWPGSSSPWASPLTWRPRSATTALRARLRAGHWVSRTHRRTRPMAPGATRPSRRPPAGRRRSPPCTCTGPTTAASGWNWPGAPSACSPRHRA
jgi:pimeloyl-ACP methyl ester carboxylesterase